MATKKLQILGSLGDSIELDATLIQEGKAADAKAVGDKFAALVGDTSVSEQIETTISNMEDLVFADEEDLATSASPLNADTLGGRPASEYALASEVATKAPAGYGLGEEVQFVTSIDNLLVPSQYKFYNGGYPLIGGVSETKSCNVEVVSSGAGCIQRITTHTGSYRAERMYSGAAWHEWEWFNPPMNFGVEYRTTERYNGKPVYTKLVNFGNLPNNNWKDIATDIPNTAGFVDISLREKFEDGGMGYNPTITIYLSHQNKSSDVYKIFVLTTSDESANTADVVIKYTKD